MIDKISDYLRWGRQLWNGLRAEHEAWIASLRSADTKLLVAVDTAPRVLDLANGQLRPQYKILRAQGYQVVGIDRINRSSNDWREWVYRGARARYANGLKSARACTDDTLICGDVGRLPFADESFDLVTSVAAFEHFLDVPQVVQETYRVLRPSGIAWVLVHLFSSPSGGHNVKLCEVPLRTMPRGVDPWDHLRRRRLPFHVPLNQWRKEQYLQEFATHFEIVKHYCALREGEHFLTPAVAAELSEYSRDELTCGAFVIVARKVA